MSLEGFSNRMDITGQHRLPAAPTRVWDALTDRRTVENCLPAGIGLEWNDAGRPNRLSAPSFGGAPAIDGAVEPLASKPRETAGFRVVPVGGGSNADAQEFHLRLADQDPFTLVDWTWSGLAEADYSAASAAIDRFFERVGQHAAVPVTVAADGAVGVAASLAAATPAARDTPFGPLLARIQAWPRDLAVGGALFALVFLIVVGIL